MRKFSQSESVWEVGTAVSSLESGYHSASWSVSGHTQHQLQHEEEVGASPGWPDRSQCWSDHLYTKVKEAGDTGDTKLDLLDSLILEDVKERLQEGRLGQLQHGGDFPQLTSQPAQTLQLHRVWVVGSQGGSGGGGAQSEGDQQQDSVVTSTFSHH